MNVLVFFNKWALGVGNFSFSLRNTAKPLKTAQQGPKKQNRNCSFTLFVDGCKILSHTCDIYGEGKDKSGTFAIKCVKLHIPLTKHESMKVWKLLSQMFQSLYSHFHISVKSVPPGLGIAARSFSLLGQSKVFFGTVHRL